MLKAGRILLFAYLFLWTGVSAWAIANPESRCSRVAAGAISNARYYDPELGRFIQPDTAIPDLSNPQSYNRYSYVLNNPLRYTDPTGHGPDDYTGASGRAMLQEDDPEAAGVAQRARQSAATMAAVGRGVAELNPIVGGFNGGYGAIAGKDAVTGKQLTTGQRWKSGGEGLLAAVPILKVGKAAEVTAGVLKIGETANDVSKLRDLDVVVGFVKEGKILGQFKQGSDFATAMSHEKLAGQLGLLNSESKLREGVEAFTVAKQNGKIGVYGSGNFVPTVTAGTEKLLKEKFQ